MIKYLRKHQAKKSVFSKAVEFLKRIDKVQLMTSEWSHKNKYWGISIISVGMWHEWSGRGNYSTNSLFWISYNNQSWHVGFWATSGNGSAATRRRGL
jgi:hypothetical protein